MALTSDEIRRRKCERSRAARKRPGYQARARERVRAQKATPEGRALWAAYSRKKNLKLDYGLTVEGYELRLLAQSGKCAVCGMAGNVGGKRLAVDHDHRTGEIRGLLCNPCNLRLGWVEDDPTILNRVAEYLRNGGFKP